MFIKELKNAVVCLVGMTILTGIAYPLFITAVAQIVFPHQANGSMLAGEQGSSLIGQSFDDPKYFWGRLSACNYNPASSSGTNYSMTNPALIDAAKSRIAALKTVDPGNTQNIPVDLVTASASGLDPHISLVAANYQIQRVASYRGLSLDTLQQLINQSTEDGSLVIIGEPVVNIIRLNMLLDSPKHAYSNKANGSDSPFHMARSSGFVH